MNIASMIDQIKAIACAALKKAEDALAEIANLPKPMLYKGTLGTGGTIQTLPAASADNNGWVYKVITKGTYEGQVAKPGDTFTSNGSVWDLTPSGDDAFVISDELATGETSITFTDDRILSTSFIGVSSEEWYTNAVQTDGSVTITFPAQASDMVVQILVAS